MEQELKELIEYIKTEKKEIAKLDKIRENSLKRENELKEEMKKISDSESGFYQDAQTKLKEAHSIFTEDWNNYDSHRTKVEKEIEERKASIISKLESDCKKIDEYRDTDATWKEVQEANDTIYHEKLSLRYYELTFPASYEYGQEVIKHEKAKIQNMENDVKEKIRILQLVPEGKTPLDIFNELKEKIKEIKKIDINHFEDIKSVKKPNTEPNKGKNKEDIKDTVQEKTAPKTKTKKTPTQTKSKTETNPKIATRPKIEIRPKIATRPKTATEPKTVTEPETTTNPEIQQKNQEDEMWQAYWEEKSKNTKTPEEIEKEIEQAYAEKTKLEEQEEQEIEAATKREIDEYIKSLDEQEKNHFRFFEIEVDPWVDSVIGSFIDRNDMIKEHELKSLSYSNNKLQDAINNIKYLVPYDIDTIAGAIDPNVLKLCDVDNEESKKNLNSYLEVLQNKKAYPKIRYNLKTIYNSNLNFKEIRNVYKIAKTAKKLNNKSVSIDKDNMLSRIYGYTKKMLSYYTIEKLQKGETDKDKPKEKKTIRKKGSELINKAVEKAKETGKEVAHFTSKNTSKIYKTVKTGAKSSVNAVKNAGTKIKGYVHDKTSKRKDRTSFVQKVNTDPEKAVKTAQEKAAQDVDLEEIFGLKDDNEENIH